MGELVDKDTEHLRLLTLFYYINAGINALFSCFALLYVAMGALVLLNPGMFGKNVEGPPAILGYLFTGICEVVLLLGWSFSACLAMTGRYLSQRRHRVFCLVIAGINCLFLPYGTVLGVFTFMVLMRPTVQALFAGAPPPIPAAPLE